MLPDLVLECSNRNSRSQGYSASRRDSVGDREELQLEHFHPTTSDDSAYAFRARRGPDIDVVYHSIVPALHTGRHMQH